WPFMTVLVHAHAQLDVASTCRAVTDRESSLHPDMGASGRGHLSAGPSSGSRSLMLPRCAYAQGAHRTPEAVCVSTTLPHRVGNVLSRLLRWPGSDAGGAACR